MDSQTAGGGDPWCAGTGGTKRLGQMNGSMREKSGEIQVRADQGWNCFCISVSNSEETLDEVISLRPMTQKPIFLQKVIFIFPFRVYWWLHKNSWKNINRVLTHFCLKVPPLHLGCKMANQPQRQLKSLGLSRRRGLTAEEITDFQSSLSCGHCKLMLLKHNIKHCLPLTLSHRNWPSLEQNRLCPLVRS